MQKMKREAISHTMMKGIKGLGIDMIEIDRIRQGIERHGEHFLNKLFTSKECAYCDKFSDPFPHFAGRFAAKEAVAKALGTGFGAELSWHDFEILADGQGKPEIHFTESAQKKWGSPQMHVSISHCTTFATAVVIWV
jgi:holo-[acyl-carrier protein] synthase